MGYFDLFSLKGQTALVTGGSSGIGAATVRVLSEAGANVVINYRGSEDAARKLRDQVRAAGGEAMDVQADVSKEDEVVAMFDSAEEALGPIDIVFSNAGLQADAAIGDMTFEDWRKTSSVILDGGFLVGREAIKRFRKKGMREDVSHALGKLVFDSSVHQRIPWAFHANYASAKGGLKLLMESLAQETASEKIRVNAVAPGAIATAINADARKTEEDRKAILDLIPYGRIGDPEDIGRVVAWLASDAADYITGQTIFVDGGMALYPGFKGNG
ncbi:Short-chain dehydrogenase/reductase SDR [Fulvimarina pelagi HTCC2506]|uniref:Short-chain dehydrogenase/reductase SDR n=2 Tax=Fulvimarina pelagi TaxID=217511 RepID=Q0G1B8_9HYPH|nr:SDR family oxidoreductase [Fulvimarina pelagi]EAU41163.1 Short-chain dehydrogenase/reductase SDR [Fulvimarina pelagi HTCC2506]BAT30823.1 short-chain dehydrogenase/reductase SDR [Fulvimarina pelagi]